MIIKNSFDFLNSDFVSGIANVSQFYNIYQSTKAANYSEMVSELQKQNSHIESIIDNQTHQLLHDITEEIKKLIKQNDEILNLLKSND